MMMARMVRRRAFASARKSWGEVHPAFARALRWEARVQTVLRERVGEDEHGDGMLGPAEAVALVGQARYERFCAVARARTNRVVCVFDRLGNEANVLACLRTMDAFGVHTAHVVLSPSAGDAAGKELEAEAVGREDGLAIWRAHMPDKGVSKWMDLRLHSNGPAACLRDLRAQGYRLVATAPPDGLDTAVSAAGVGGSEALNALFPVGGGVPEGGKWAIVFGNEAHGNTASTLAVCDKLYIPMRGMAQSLNVNASCVAILAHLSAAGLLEPNLSLDEQRRLCAQWLLRPARASAMSEASLATAVRQTVQFSQRHRSTPTVPA